MKFLNFNINFFETFRKFLKTLGYERQNQIKTRFSMPKEVKETQSQKEKKNPLSSFEANLICHQNKFAEGEGQKFLLGKFWLTRRLGCPIWAENLRKLCKDIYFLPKKFLVQKFLCIPKNRHVGKTYFQKRLPLWQ